MSPWDELARPAEPVHPDVVFVNRGLYPEWDYGPGPNGHGGQRPAGPVQRRPLTGRERKGRDGHLR